MATGMLISPLLDSIEHVALNLDIIIPGRRMMERTENIIHNFVYRNRCVLPGIENTRDNILKNSSSNATCT